MTDEVIRRLPELCRPEAIAGLDAQVRWELTAGRTTYRYGIVFDHGTVEAGPDLAVTPRVTLRCSADDALRAITGEAEPTLMVLDGRLELSGDERFAVEMLGFFQVPGGAVPKDPTKVDVGDVARTVAGVSERDLRGRLTGGVREILLAEIFRRMPDYVRADRTGDLDVVVGWQITGAPDGGHDEFRTRISRGACTLDAYAEPVTASLRMDPALFLKIVTGGANPVTSFLRRKISVHGDVALAMRLPQLFAIPHA